MADRFRAGKRLWEPEDDDKMRLWYPDLPNAEIAQRLHRTVQSIYGRAEKLGLHKSEAYLASPHACRLRRGDNVGAAFRFKKGQTSHNKGLRRPGYSVGRGRMQETQFKKGCRNGVAARVYKPVGTERISKDGYLERKVRDYVAPPGATPEEQNRQRQRIWRAVHIIVWEEANGPLPKGHAVVFKDGNKRNIDLGNLELITRRELMLRNTIHNLPPELKETVQLLSRVNRQIRKRERHGNQEQDRRSA